MNRDDAIALLQSHEAELHEAGVGRLYLFGSVARNEARADSDVDLFFDAASSRFSLIELVHAQERIKAILGTSADLMTRGSLHPLLRPQIEAEAVRVF